MMKIMTLVAVCAVALSGCAVGSMTNGNANTGASTISTQHFVCNNGLDVAIKRLGNDQIELTTSPDVKRAVLTQAPSGSGERYVASTGLWGNGGEWHQKGGTAYFEYVGVHGGAPKSATCNLK